MDDHDSETHDIESNHGMTHDGANHRTGLTLSGSTAPRAGTPYDRSAPDVVVIVLDDLGFAQLGCYGSDIDTPNLDRLAERGLRFTNFHTTAVCSPTRACLLTGRNHHRVGMGMLPEIPVNYPAYTGRFPAEAATLAQILSGEGYATTCIGKWHLVPRDQRANGPFDMWPTRLGFDRYYGFLNGETNQWTPNLIRDQSHVEPPATPDEGYHLEADLADEAIAQLRSVHLHDPDRPFFLWYASGAPHAPHQAPPEWIERYRGRFDAGWDDWRERTFARQKEMGIVPADAVLSERPEWVEAWDELDADRQALYARMMEVFAGFLSHTDHHVGRVLDAIDELGRADDTIVVLVSDNGCSAEGGPHGSWNQLRHYISDLPDDIAVELEHLEELGGPRSSGHYPWGWALAGNTPFRRWKRYTFEGGVRDPLIISCPNRLDDHGSLRHQYLHAVDVPMTILGLAGIEAPDTVAGVPQMSYDGVAATDVLADPASPDPRTEQYYEMWGSRAMYADGWKAVTDHVNQLTAAERESIAGSSDFAEDRWHLFHVADDPSESVDLAEAEPERLAALVESWHSAAEANQVLPLDDGRDARVAQIHVPWLNIQGHHRYEPGDKVHEVHGPLLMGGFRMSAEFSAPLEPADQGVICEQGDWIAGWAWYLCDGTVTWVLAFDGREERVSAPIPDGCRLISVEGRNHPDGGMVFSLHGENLDGVETAQPAPWPGAISPDGAFLTVGYGRPFPVTDDYEPPFGIGDKLTAVHVAVGAPPPFDLDAELAHVMRHQ